jgi:hypothetical protein
MFCVSFYMIVLHLQAPKAHIESSREGDYISSLKALVRPQVESLSSIPSPMNLIFCSELSFYVRSLSPRVSFGHQGWDMLVLHGT